MKGKKVLVTMLVTAVMTSAVLDGNVHAATEDVELLRYALKTIVIEKGQSFSYKDILYSYKDGAVAKPKMTSSKPAVLKVKSNGTLKGVKTGTTKLTLKSGKKKMSVKVKVVDKKYSKTDSYKSLEKKMHSFAKSMAKTGVAASNCKKVMTKVSKLSKLANEQAVDIFKGEYQKQWDKDDEKHGLTSVGSYHIIGEMKDVYENVLSYDYWKDCEFIDAREAFVFNHDSNYCRLISDDVRILNQYSRDLRHFLDKWNPFDEQNKTAFKETAVEQKGDTLIMKLKEPVTNKQLLGSLTLFGSGHSISAWAYQLPEEKTTEQVISCSAILHCVSGGALDRYYTGSYTSGTDAITWTHDLSQPSHIKNDTSTTGLPAGKYVLFYAPELNEEFGVDSSKRYYKKWKKATTKADYEDLYDEFGCPNGLSHFGFYEFSVE